LDHLRSNGQSVRPIGPWIHLVPTDLAGKMQPTSASPLCSSPQMSQGTHGTAEFMPESVSSTRPNSQDVSRHLGHLLYELSSDTSDPFAHSKFAVLKLVHVDLYWTNSWWCSYRRYSWIHQHKPWWIILLYSTPLLDRRISADVSNIVPAQCSDNSDLA
jgi:hypothetical protein